MQIIFKDKSKTSIMKLEEKVKINHLRESNKLDEFT